MFTDYFDTTVGQKTDSESYKKIASEIKIDPVEILFLTDLPEGENSMATWSVPPFFFIAVRLLAICLGEGIGIQNRVWKGIGIQGKETAWFKQLLWLGFAVFTLKRVFVMEIFLHSNRIFTFYFQAAKQMCSYALVKWTVCSLWLACHSNFMRGLYFQACLMFNTIMIVLT